MSPKTELLIPHFQFDSFSDLRVQNSKEVSEFYSKVTVEDILNGKIDSRNTNILISEQIIKKHNPNKVFKNLYSLINENQTVTLSIVTAENNKVKLKRVIPSPLFPIYYFLHVFFRRVAPKIKGLKTIWNVLNLPVDISKAEIIGRLIFNGLDIVKAEESNSETTITVKKNQTENPSLVRKKPSAGFLFKMQRLGVNGNKIIVYKLRSMHPYAEYAQDYIYKTHGLDVGGKFKNDFRISTGGKLIRKYWIDELPMLINLLKGDIKLIGVRPISQHYFDLYPDKLKNLRLLTKPGLLPPFYADMPKTFDQIVQSEINYIELYLKNPLSTDIQYLFKILKNIFIKNVRSK